MRITDVRATVVSVPFNKERLWSLGSQKGTTRTILEVETDENITGIGETIGASKDIIENRIRPVILGEDPSNILRVCEKAKWRTPWATVNTPNLVPVAGIEMALWDIKGKLTDRTVSNLLGGEFRDKATFLHVTQLPVSRDENISEENAVESLLCEIDGAVRRFGFDTIQLYVAVFSPEFDVHLVGKIREKFGSALKIGIDVNRTWSAQTAIQTLTKMEQHSLDYVEDVTSGILAMARVRNAATVPFSTHYTDLYQIASLRAADVVVGDIHDFGGFIGTMKLIAQCEAFNLGFWFHSSNELGVSLAAMTQIIAASPHIVHPSQTIVGLLTDDVITEPFRFRKGAVELPKKPGLGVELDRNNLDKYSKLYVDSGEFGFHEPDSRRQGWFPQISGI